MAAPKKGPNVLSNCVGSSAYQGVSLLVTPARLVTLLQAATRAPGEIQRGANDMLTDMGKGAWRITGGTGDRVEVLTAGGPRTLQVHTVSCEIRSIR
jgi:hypothetical protein